MWRHLGLEVGATHASQLEAGELPLHELRAPVEQGELGGGLLAAGDGQYRHATLLAATTALFVCPLVARRHYQH